MLAIAAKFSVDMQRITALLDLCSSAVALAKVDAKGIRSKHQLVASALSVQQHLKGGTHPLTVAYDGAFLTVCADFELAVRDLIGRYVERAAAKCADYSHLPSEMRDWYPRGCAEILLALKEDRFKHLTQAEIHRSLASCLASPSKPYTLLGDAFSNNRNNFWPEQIDSHLSKRLGIDKVWQKLSREAAFQTAIGAPSPATAETVGRTRLKEVLSRRNDIVHRGRGYYTAGESEVRAATQFVAAFITSLAAIMENQWTAL